MNTYIVTYDLRKEVTSDGYQQLIRLIKEEDAWARLGGSSYLVQSCRTAVELRDKYKCVLDKNDMLYVGKVTAPAAWHGYNKEVASWIIKKLGDKDE